MSALGERLLGIWYEDRRGAWLLAPVSWLYRTVVTARRGAYRRGWLRSGHPGIPVIVVGNITAGGAGKTPVAQWLGGRFRESGQRAVIVSRGYGGRAQRKPVWVAAGTDPGEVGDEPVLMAQEGLEVVVCVDRLAAACFARDGGAELIIADDGLQHYRLGRDFELVVIDGDRGLGNGRCIPAGPLREPVSRLAEADMTLCNGGGRCPSGAIDFELDLGDARCLKTGHVRALADFRSGPVHAVAGIGNPRRFFGALERQGLETLTHAFPDHYAYKPEDLAFEDRLPILMTSKDAVKVRSFSCSRHWEVPAVVRFPEGKGDRLFDRIAAAVNTAAGQI